MATLTTAARNAAVDAITALINVGGTGTIVFKTAGAATLATLTFSADAFGDGATGVATANSITADSSADATGTVTNYDIKSGAGTSIMTGAAGTSGDFVFNTAAWTAGDNISVSALTVTMPAS